MSKNIIDNKRIAKNTIFLYVRLMIVMIVSLYTVRVILNALGVVDYGIYNVVGGMVSMFGFLNAILAASSQRYLSMALVEDDVTTVQKWFFLNILAALAISVVIVFFAEPIGLWLLKKELSIPDNRKLAAHIVFQTSVLMIVISMIKIPYDALIIAHERMNAYALFGIIDAGAKLLIAFLIKTATFDKLILYTCLMLCESLLYLLLFYYYCRFYFAESKLRFYWNWTEFKDLLKFSGWNLFGSISFMLRSQGINILLNVFFTPVVNAARGVAFQVSNAISQFSGNFFSSARPQVYKSYQVKDYVGFEKLVLRSSMMCYFLYSLMFIPLYANIELILNLWLGKGGVPEYTVIFTQLVLINGMAAAGDAPIMAAAFATKDIKMYQIIVASLNFMNLPISYVALKCGAFPQATMYIAVCITYISIYVRGFMVSRKCPFSIKPYFLLALKVTLVSIIILLSVLVLKNFIPNQWIYLSSSIIIGTVFNIVLYSYCVMNKNDRNTIFAILKQKFHSK